MLNPGRCLLSLLLEFGFLTFAMAFLFFFLVTKNFDNTELLPSQLSQLFECNLKHYVV